MNLISRAHHSYEKKEHAFMVLREYTIISLVFNTKMVGLLKVTKMRKLYGVSLDN